MNELERAEQSAPQKGITLCAADAAALDAMMSRRAGSGLKMAAEEAASADPARSRRVEAWLGVLDCAPAPACSTSLLSRTLAAVADERMKLSPREAAGVSPRPGSVADVGARRGRKPRYLGEIAAMLVAATLLGAVLIPAIGQARQSYRRTLCATNLSQLAGAFGTYATANDRQLPSLPDSADRNWLHPAADGHTNTANLLPLIRAGYVSPARFICAGRGLPDSVAAIPTANDLRDCGYSYINLFGKTRPIWNNRAATIVLADHNPLFVGGGVTNPDCSSLNHGGKGTYVLRADGHVTWEISPNVGPAKDNIWTVGTGSNRLTQYTGIEVAEGPEDVFLSP